MAKEKVDFKGRRDDSLESKEEEDGLSLIETLEDKEPELKELEMSDFTYGIKIYFIILAYVLILMIFTLFLPTSIAFILWILAGVGIYKGFETYGEDKPWFSELSEMIQNFGFSSTKDDWGEGEVEDIDGETIEEENTLNFENYAEKFDEWRVTKDTVSAPFISAGDTISKFSFNSDGLYKFRLWTFILTIPLIWWLLFAGGGILPIIFGVWYLILGFSITDATNLGNISALILSYFLIIRIYSYFTNQRRIPFRTDMMSDYDPYVVSHLFQYPQSRSSVSITSKALLLDFVGGWFIIIFMVFAGSAASIGDIFGLNTTTDLSDFISLVIALILFAIAVPIVEELLFRGLILDGLSETYGSWTAIFISSAIFAILHISPLSIINAFWGGMIYGYLRIRTNSLWPGILLHALWNGHLELLNFFYFV